MPQHKPAPITEREYILFCDESDRKGKYFSNFYDGLRVPASQLQRVSMILQKEKERLGITSEIKWAKTDANLMPRYKEFIKVFFNQIMSKRLFMRVMFTQNAIVPVGLSSEQLADTYYILYYQFLKHGFGFAHMPIHAQPARLRIYLDEIGDNKEQIAKFKGFIKGFPNFKSIRQAGGLVLEEQDISEVSSHDHIRMQALDVVLGSITFRLNEKHRFIPEGCSCRGKRTVAKEKLYKFILSEIRRVTSKPHFNIGISTGLTTYPSGLWSDPYRHWLFSATDHQIDPSAFKSENNNAPLGPT